VSGPRARALLLGGLVVVGLLLWWLLPASGLRTDPASVTAASTGRVTSTVASSSAIAPRPTRTIGPTRTTGAASGDLRSRDLRTKARGVLAVVDATGAAPKGYVGGRRFMNDGRGGTEPLPRTSGGRTVVYHEYDVNPFREGVDRGAQRLVVGDDGSAYCTPDHYDSWIRLR
jgi:guanyl-specific ribonuclease Sa